MAHRVQVFRFVPMIDAPLGLANVLTVLLAVSCLSINIAQARAGIVRMWRLAIPAVFAAVVAIVLLAGVFQASLPHDGEWLAALAGGALLGRISGRSSTIDIDRIWNLAHVPRNTDALLAATGLVVLSLVDFASAALRSPVIAPVHVAAASAFCAGFLGWRAIGIISRSPYATHVELHSADRGEAGTRSARRNGAFHEGPSPD
jgi:hypothetical protein